MTQTQFSCKIGQLTTDKADTGFSSVSLSGEQISTLFSDDKDIKQFRYSPVGNYIALQLPSLIRIVRINGDILREFPLSDVLDFEFSPQETYLATYSKFTKPNEGAPPNNNVKIWNVQSGEEIISFAQKNFNDWYMVIVI